MVCACEAGYVARSAYRSIISLAVVKNARELVKNKLLRLPSIIASTF
jgi:hypothetical protein